MRKRNTNEPERIGKQAPPRTPEEQENIMIGLAMQQAERMLREGNAPVGVVTHFLHLATERERAQVEKVKAEAEMAIAKADYVRMQQKHEQDYQNVVDAFRGYGGNTGVLNSTERNEVYDFDVDFDDRYKQ